MGCSFLAGAPAQAASLQEAVLQSWSTHPSLKALDANEGYAYRQRQEEYSAYLPTLSLTGMAGRQFGDNSTTRGLSVTRGQGYSYLWELQSALRQNFYDGGGRAGRVEAAEIREDAIATQKDGTKLGLAGGVVASYLEVLRTYYALSLIAQHRAQIDDYLTRMESARAEGAIDEAEYRQALDLSLSWDMITPPYEMQLENAKAAYFELTGQSVMGKMETPFLAPDLFAQGAAQMIDHAIFSHPLLRQQRAELEALGCELDAGYSEFKPRIDGELSYLESDKKDLLGGEVTDARATMRMSWDFETGGGAFHRIGKQKFLIQEGKQRLQELEQQVARDLTFAYNEYDAALKGLEAIENRSTIAQEILITSQEQFDGARISLLQLMQAENQAFQMDLDVIDAQNRVLLAQYGIMLAAGRLDVFTGSAPASVVMSAAEMTSDE